MSRWPYSLIGLFLVLPTLTSASGVRDLPQACLVAHAQLADDQSAAYVAALQIEARKRGLRWEWILVADPGTCAPDGPVLSIHESGNATLSRPGAPLLHIELARIPASARPRALARVVHEALSAHPEPSPSPLLGADDEIVPGEVPAGRARPVLTPASSWVIRIGGAYSHQIGPSRHLGGPSLEIGYSLFKGRLAFSLVGGYALSPEITPNAGSSGSVEAVALQCPELLAMARGGLRFGAVVLRAGFGGGWQHRVVSFTDASAGVSAEACRIRCSELGGDIEACVDECVRAGAEVSTSSNVAVLAGDLEVLWAFAGRWSLGLLFNTRAYLGGDDHRFEREVVYSAPSTTLGAQLFLGVEL